MGSKAVAEIAWGWGHTEACPAITEPCSTFPRGAELHPFQPNFQEEEGLILEGAPTGLQAGGVGQKVGGLTAVWHVGMNAVRQLPVTFWGSPSWDWHLDAGGRSWLWGLDS